MNLTDLNFSELVTLEYALCNRIEFLTLQKIAYKDQPQLEEYYTEEIEKVKDLSIKLNIPLSITF
jgi:hypothetical protein